MREELRAGNFGVISRALLSSMDETLASNEQVYIVYEGKEVFVIAVIVLNGNLTDNIVFFSFDKNGAFRKNLF